MPLPTLSVSNFETDVHHPLQIGLKPSGEVETRVAYKLAFSGGTVSPEELNFDGSDWNRFQTFKLSELLQGNHRLRIVHGDASTDLAIQVNEGDWDGDGIPDASDPDDDGDGISDEDEERYGFDPNEGSDATQDADGDGISNIDEINGGSDPNDDKSLIFKQTLAAGWNLFSAKGKTSP